MVMEQVHPLAEKDRRELHPHLDDIVGNQTVPAQYQIEGTFALADAALAEQQHTDAENIDEDAVHGGRRQQALLEKLGDQGDEGGRNNFV